MRQLNHVSRRGLRDLLGDDRGQDLAEYGIALAVIASTVGFIAVFIGLVEVDLWTNAQQAIDFVSGGS